LSGETRYQNLVSRKAIKEKTVDLTIVEDKARWDVTIIATGRKNTYAPGHECLPSLVRIQVTEDDIIRTVKKKWIS
jgi:hypothetical protein